VTSDSRVSAPFQPSSQKCNQPQLLSALNSTPWSLRYSAPQRTTPANNQGKVSSGTKENYSNPLEELEAVTKQITANKLTASGSSNRAISPTDQFLKDLLNPGEEEKSR